MKRNFLLLLLTLVAAGLVFAAPMTGTAGKYTVQLITSSPLKVGENILTLMIKDGEKPATDTGVAVHLDMVGMSMPADAKVEPVRTPGGYQAKVNLSMEGQWKITVKVQQMAGMDMAGDGKADFILTVGKSAAATTPAPVAPSVPAPADTTFPWGWVAGGLVVVGLIGVMVALRGRRGK
ncbi:MAG: FixH family protein [Armatimonadota bacterium]